MAAWLIKKMVNILIIVFTSKARGERGGGISAAVAVTIKKKRGGASLHHGKK